MHADSSKHALGSIYGHMQSPQASTRDRSYSPPPITVPSSPLRDCTGRLLKPEAHHPPRTQVSRGVSTESQLPTASRRSSPPHPDLTAAHACAPPMSTTDTNVQLQSRDTPDALKMSTCVIQHNKCVRFIPPDSTLFPLSPHLTGLNLSVAAVVATGTLLRNHDVFSDQSPLLTSYIQGAGVQSHTLAKPILRLQTFATPSRDPPHAISHHSTLCTLTEVGQAHGSVVGIGKDEPRPSLLRVGREEIVGTELHAAQCVAASVPDRVHLQGGGRGRRRRMGRAGEEVGDPTSITASTLALPPY